MFSKLSFLLITPILLIAAGCAVYSFSPGGKSSIKALAIPPFENKTVESGLSSRITDLVIDAFISNGTLKVVAPDGADAILTGTLTNYERKAKNYDEADNVTQYAVYLTFDITLKEATGDKEIWRDKFYSEGIYDANTESEDDGQARATGKLVVDIINRTTKSW